MADHEIRGGKHPNPHWISVPFSHNVNFKYMIRSLI